MDKFDLSERDICTKFITPATQGAGWRQAQFREEVSLTDGRVMVRGQLAARVRNPGSKGGPKRADYVLYARPSVPLAVVEAKQARFPVGHGMQQALACAEMLDAPFAISSNGTLDVFDLVAHVAFDQTPLTRRKRANNVKKRDVFGKCGDEARSVFEALLENFVDHGMQNFVYNKVLELSPMDQLSGKTEMWRGIFGWVEQLTQVVRDLEQALYEDEEKKQA